MGADEQRINGQLMVIEHVYGIKFAGRDEMARAIAAAASDDREAMRICTAVNTWTAPRIKGKEISMPDETLQELIRRVKRQSV